MRSVVQWFRCLTGRHEWAQLDDEHGFSCVVCLWCGNRRP